MREAGARRVGLLRDLGTAEYEPTWELQKQLVAERQEGRGADTLLLVEHPHVITLGRRAGSMGNVLSRQMPVVEVERGGDVTYHGPGQLVGYPIVRLDEGERDVHAFLRRIEEGLIAACAGLGVAAERRERYTGVWVGERKIASIGVAVRGWVTMHGFALNVSTELARFEAIRPCGMEAAVMTSLDVVLGKRVEMGTVKAVVAREMGHALHREFTAQQPTPERPQRTGP